MIGYLTLAAPAQIELEIKRSRFLAFLEPTSSEFEAREFIGSLRTLHPRARHHCTAFVLGSRQELQRSNDDGEPSGTAGAPMLEALVAAELSDVTAVVVRYFGGVLLGAGGLTRAYRAAVADAVAIASLVRREPRERVQVDLDYARAHTLGAEASRRGWSVDMTYGERVTVTVAIPPADVAEATQLFSNLTAGLTHGEPLGIDWVDVPAIR